MLQHIKQVLPGNNSRNDKLHHKPQFLEMIWLFSVVTTCTLLGVKFAHRFRLNETSSVSSKLQ